MPYQPVPNTALCQLKYAAGGIQAQNDVYFHRDAGWSEPELTALAEDCTEAWDTFVSPVVVAEWALVEVVATNLEDEIGLKQIWRPAIPIQGQRTENSAPANVSMAVKFQAPRRGRGISGRVFVVGLPETEVGLGSVVSVYANEVVTAWRNFAGDVETNSDCQHVIVHRVVGGVRIPVATVDSVAGYAYTDLSIDSMKLRLPNHKKAKRPAPTP